MMQEYDLTIPKIKDEYMNRYPRDMIGYGAQPPFADWPNNAKIAVQFVLNYEEGGENYIYRDGQSNLLSEIDGSAMA